MSGRKTRHILKIQKDACFVIFNKVSGRFHATTLECERHVPMLTRDVMNGEGVDLKDGRHSHMLKDAVVTTVMG